MTNTRVVVRTAVEADIPRILEIAAQSVTQEWTYRYVQDRLSRDDSFLLAAEQLGSSEQPEQSGTVPNCKSDTPGLVSDSTVVGFASFRQVGDDGELLQIAVDTEHMREGIGDLLMSSVLEYAYERRFNSVFLEVRESNTAAIALYKKHGFEHVRVRKSYYTNPVENALIMAKTYVIVQV